MKFATVDLQHIIESNEHFQDLRKQSQNAEQKIRLEEEHKQNDLQKKEVALTKKRNTLSSQALQKELDQLNQEKEKMREEHNTRIRKLELDYLHMLEEAKQKVTETLKIIAKEKNYIAIFDRSTLIYSDLDNINELIISRLNQT